MVVCTKCLLLSGNDGVKSMVLTQMSFVPLTCLACKVYMFRLLSVNSL